MSDEPAYELGMLAQQVNAPTNPLREPYYISVAQLLTLRTGTARDRHGAPDQRRERLDRHLPQLLTPGDERTP
jgi:hypothetical protein